MELKALLNKGSLLLKKYKYVVLILLIGIVLMMLPSVNHRGDPDEPVITTVENDIPLEERLEELLQHVEGAGRVKVILTIAAGEEIIYQMDENISNNENSNTVVTDTITVSNADRNQTGLIKQIVPARYQGAIIVCNGADNPTVKLDIINAVSRLTGLGVNAISVLKMK